MARRLSTVAGFVGVASALALLTASPAAADPTQSQTVTFTSTAPEGEDWFGNGKFGDGIVSAAASSGLPVTLSIDPASTDACLLHDGPYDTQTSSPSPAVLYFLGPGTCTIHADQAGNDVYLPAAQATQSFVLDKVQPTLGVLRERSWVGRKRTFRATLMVPTWFSSFNAGLYGFPDQVVTFSVSGHAVCSGTTTNDWPSADVGVATCTATLGASDWLKPRFTASYAGNELYKPVSRTGPTFGDRNPTDPGF
jgi:hypothetical protein